MRLFPQHTIDSFENRLIRIGVAAGASILSGIGVAATGVSVLVTISLSSVVGVVAWRIVREIQRSRNDPPGGMA